MTPGGMAKMGNPDGLSQSGMHGKMRNPVATTKERDARVKSGVNIDTYNWEGLLE